VLDFIIDHVKEAGEICSRAQDRLGEADIIKKSDKDLVTPIDREVERFLTEAIRARFPTHDIIGEEHGKQVHGGDWCWIIDPIDGTTSYCHGQPYYSVSVAVRQGTELQAAAVYAPALGQLFHAERGGGAYLNDRPVHVSACDQLDSAVLATGFACLRAGHSHNNLPYLNRLLPAIRDIRRCGSAALDLAYVAAGKLDGFWELDLNLYDIAAGVLLVREAGGDVCDFHGRQAFPERGTVATNGRITGALLRYTDVSEEP